MQTIMSLFIYFFCIISTVIFVGIASKAKCKKASFLFLSFAILLPSIMAGLRQNVGTDYNQYLQIYSTVAGGGNFLAFRLNEIEAGFMLLNKICIFFGGGYHSVLFAAQFITQMFIIAFLWNERKNINPFWGIFIYMMNYYQRSLNIVRQSIAISICIFAFTYLADEKASHKYVKYIILILAAASFHTSALICLGVLAVQQIYKKRGLRVLHYVSFVFILVLIFCRKQVGVIVGILLNSPNYYASYFIRDAATDSSLITYIVKIFLLIYPSIIVYKKILGNKKFLLYFNLMIVGAILGLFSKFTLTYVDRISYFFIYLIIAVIPYSLKVISKRNYLIVAGSYIWITTFFWIYNYFIKGYSGTIPFQTFL